MSRTFWYLSASAMVVGLATPIVFAVGQERPGQICVVIVLKRPR